jgi:Zn-dependent peptidase ImmA (M78 family)
MNKGERKADETLKRLGLTIPPVDVEEVARRSDAEVRFRKLDGDIAGLLLRSDDMVIIGVNADQPKVRQRFTIAHELGHYLMHKGRPTIVETLQRARVNWRDGTSSQATDLEEIEANQFAAALLMPRVLIEKYYFDLLKKGLDADAAVDPLARRFEVSAQAMRFRLANLALTQPS